MNRNYLPNLNERHAGGEWERRGAGVDGASDGSLAYFNTDGTDDGLKLKKKPWCFQPGFCRRNACVHVHDFDSTRTRHRRPNTVGRKTPTCFLSAPKNLPCYRHTLPVTCLWGRSMWFSCWCGRWSRLCRRSRLRSPSRRATVSLRSVFSALHCIHQSRLTRSESISEPPPCTAGTTTPTAGTRVREQVQRTNATRTLHIIC